MTEVEEIIYQYEGQQREIMLHLHHWLINDLYLTSKPTFKNPGYYGKSWICYLNPTKKGTVEFAFFRGNELSNIQGLLNSRGRKQVSSVEFETLKEIPIDTLTEIMHEAILLDETKPYESKRKKK